MRENRKRKRKRKREIEKKTMWMKGRRGEEKNDKSQ